MQEQTLQIDRPILKPTAPDIQKGLEHARETVARKLEPWSEKSREFFVKVGKQLKGKGKNDFEKGRDVIKDLAKESEKLEFADPESSGNDATQDNKAGNNAIPISGTESGGTNLTKSADESPKQDGTTERQNPVDYLTNGVKLGSEEYEVLYSKDSPLAVYLVELHEYSTNLATKKPEKYPDQNYNSLTRTREIIRDHLIRNYIRKGIRPPIEVHDIDLMIKSDRIALLQKEEEKKFDVATREQRDRELGTSQDLFFHNGRTFSSLKYILNSKAILSHRSLLNTSGQFTFSTGAARNNNVEDVTITKEGIKYKMFDGGERFITHSDYQAAHGKVKGIGSILQKDPFLEFDQVLFGENDAYFDSAGWAVVLPKRQIIANYQYSAAQDGIHIFDKNFDSDSISSIEESNGFPPGKVGAKIDLDTLPFIIAVDSTRNTRLSDWLGSHFPNVPDVQVEDTVTSWTARHVVQVESLNHYQNAGAYLDPIRQAMFSRFNIPEYKGHQIPTGNRGDGASGKHQMNLYTYSLS